MYRLLKNGYVPWEFRDLRREIVYHPVDPVSFIGLIDYESKAVCALRDTTPGNRRGSIQALASVLGWDVSTVGELCTAQLDVRLHAFQQGAVF